MPRTEKEKCSFVEKISTIAQPPRWFVIIIIISIIIIIIIIIIITTTRFVSHWWGEPVQSMIYCLKQHAEDRGF